MLTTRSRVGVVGRRLNFVYHLLQLASYITTAVRNAGLQCTQCSA